MKVFFKSVVVVLLLGASAYSSAESLRKLQQLLESIQSFKAGFTQQTLDNFGQAKQTIKGHMLVKKPGFLRWQTEGDYAQLVIADGSSIWIYDEDLENVTIKPMGKEMSETPALLLSGNVESIAKDFEVSLQGNEYTLTPKDSSQLFDRLILEFNQHSLVRMAISDASGLTTEITFSAVETNPDIKNSMFVFEAPQGVDIIDSRP